MNKRQKNQSGFGAVEALLVIVALGIVGFTGWYVLKAKHNADASYDNAAKSSSATVASAKDSQPQSSSEQNAVKPSADGNFTFSYPASWTVVSNKDPNTVLSINSPDEQSNAKDAVTNGALIHVYKKEIDSSYFGNSLSEYMQNYGSGTPTSVTVGGQSGLRLEGKGFVAIAFTKDNDVYGVDEYYPSGSVNPYPKTADDIAASFKLKN